MLLERSKMAAAEDLACNEELAAGTVNGLRAGRALGGDLGGE